MFTNVPANINQIRKLFAQAYPQNTIPACKRKFPRAAKVLPGLESLPSLFADSIEARGVLTLTDCVRFPFV